MNDINSALVHTLGGECDTPGIAPATLERRLNALDTDTKALVQSYLTRVEKFRIPNSLRPIANLADVIEKWLCHQTPELSAVARSKLACYYSYCHR